MQFGHPNWSNANGAFPLQLGKGNGSRIAGYFQKSSYFYDSQAISVLSQQLNNKFLLAFFPNCAPLLSNNAQFDL